jgi:hypothetical protein
MSLKIHPDGTVELASEEDLRLYQLYQAMHGNGAAPAPSTPAANTNDEPADVTAPPTPPRTRVTRIRISSEKASILRKIKEFQPDVPGRTDISDHLSMPRQRVSEQLAELKKLGLVTNGAPPNTWRWRLTESGENAITSLTRRE